MARKISFKDRMRRNSQRHRLQENRSTRKQLNIRHRNCNRFDNVYSGGRSMEDLVRDVESGDATLAHDADLDPRSLADLLARTCDDGKKHLDDVPLPPDDPMAVTLHPLDDRKSSGMEETHDPKNKNRYKHRGSPYVFWENLGLHPALLAALRELRFTHPTPVQESALPEALSYGRGPNLNEQKDVVVSAETGSGKTLVFAIPILQRLLETLESSLGLQIVPGNGPPADVPEGSSAASEKRDGSRPPKTKRRLECAPPKVADERVSKSEKESSESRVMFALIVSPTRELALQINDCMKQLTQCCRNYVRIGCVVGGMAPEKQQRILNKAPHVLICTPGRLWELVGKNEGCYLGHSVSRRLRFVILDEADKLLQSGRFEELKKLLERIHCEVLPAGRGQARDDDDETRGTHPAEDLQEGIWDEQTQTFVPAAEERCRHLLKDAPRPTPFPPVPAPGHRVVTFLTSATLSLQTNYVRKDLRANKSIIRTSNADTMTSILNELGMRVNKTMVINMSPQPDVVARINETFLRCPEKSKDLYLYAFLKTHRERTIVFVNAISMLRRLQSILGILGLPVVSLHASMQQRQRLRFIEKFKTGDKRVLIATDIASRGLDVDGIRHVVHYQIPRSTDAYIHRCGRTARCGGTGLSVMMVSAIEFASFKKLLLSLGRTENSMEVFALDPSVVHHLHSHLSVAFQIDKLLREVTKTSADQRWTKRMGDAAEVDTDDLTDPEAVASNHSKQKAVKKLQAQLKFLLHKETNGFGGKGSFRSGSLALGTAAALSKQRDKAERQTLKTKKY